jgi:uncharacterized membrane protein
VFIISGELATLISLPEATPQVPRPRIQGLSDLIFGLALSIGAVQLVTNLPTNPGDLTNDIYTFGFSFLILINVWNRYTATTSVMPVETPLMVRLNMALLFLVAIEPFLFEVMIVNGFAKAVGAEASLYYGIDIGAMNLVLAYFTHLLAQEERKLIPREMIGRYKATRDNLILGAAIFLASDFPLYAAIDVGGLALRVILWILVLPMLWLPRVFGKE